MTVETVDPLARLLWILNTLFHQSVAIVAVFILWTIIYYNNITEKFTWHIILCTISYVPLMAEAIVLFADNNVWSLKISRTKKYWIHGCLLLISAISLTIGNIFVITSKSSGHFISTHAWTALISWIFVLLSQIIGLLATQSQLFKNIIRPIHIKCLHNICGLLGYIFGIVSLTYGLEKGSFSAHVTNDSRIAITCMLWIAVVWSILAALKSVVHQFKTIIFG